MMDLKIEHFQKCHETSAKIMTLNQRSNRNTNNKFLNGNEINANSNTRLEKLYGTNIEVTNVREKITTDNDDDDDDKQNEGAFPDSNDNIEQEVIKCIFLCKFHATAGPKIAAQVPNNYISKEIFDTVSRYVIPKVQLQRSFLSV